MQHGHAPRPLPLFLELVREVSLRDPDLARRALAGLRAYEAAPRAAPQLPGREIARVCEARLIDHGGDGPPVILVPSLINPPRVLDLDPEVSLAGAVRRMGRRALLVDWGPASARRELDVGGHVADILVPLIGAAGREAALVGYCLGGTMALAAANLARVERVATLAAPWHFARYPDESRVALNGLWQSSRASAEAMGYLPMELLQAAFWSLDRDRVVAKYAAFAGWTPTDPRARRFVAMEDWANEGEALPFLAAAELIEELFGGDLPGRGQWRVGGRAVGLPDCALLSLTAAADRIAPAATAPDGPTTAIPSGHVGMVVGAARVQLWDALASFLADA